MIPAPGLTNPTPHQRHPDSQPPHDDRHTYGLLTSGVTSAVLVGWSSWGKQLGYLNTLLLKWDRSLCVRGWL